MEKVQKRLSDSNVHPFFKNYKEEVCGYLIEEAAKEINKTPKVQRWFQEVTSTVKVWLSEHGVLDVSRLKTQDLVTIAKANVKEIARQKPEVKLSPEGMKVLAEHVKAMNFKYSKITDAEPEIKTLYRKFVELDRQENLFQRQLLSRSRKADCNDKRMAMSTGLNKTHQRRDVILASLCDYFGKSTIDNLLLCGFLRVIEKLQTDELDGISIASKIHKKTKNIVPDELATPDNEEGIIAELPHLKEGFPACPIVVRIGFHIPFVHRGAGSRHLTGNVIEFPNRDFFPKEENKTEGSLKGLVEVLKNSSQLYQLNPLKYVFYSSKHQYGIVCTLNEKSNRLEVVTVRPVRKKELPKIYGAISG